MQEIVTRQQPLIPYDFQLRQFKTLSLKRFLSLNFIASMMQFGGLTLTTLNASPCPLWLASGASCGLIFMWGSRILPGIFLGGFLAYFLAKAGLILATIAAAIFTFQIGLLLRFSYRYIVPTLIFYERLLFLKFILLAGLLTAFATYILVIFSSHTKMPLSLLQQWLQWWLANLDGLLIFSFALIALDSYFSQLSTLKKHLFELFLLYGLLIACTIALLGSTHFIASICFTALICILHLVISRRYAWCGMAFAAFIIALLAYFGAILHAPFFHGSFLTPLSAFIYLEIFLFLWVVLGGCITKKGRTVVVG